MGYTMNEQSSANNIQLSQQVNESRQLNYVSLNGSIYILGDFDRKSMNELIGHISNMIQELPITPKYAAKGTITSPYDTTGIKNPIIDIYIDSNGGDTNMLRDISTLLNIAKSRGAIIRTTVLSRAYSCGSMLAIQGTPGFRIMSTDATHLIHFGSINMLAQSEQMLDHLAAHNKEIKKQTHSKYATYTKLPKKEIQRLTTTEGEFLNAQKCLEYGLCDWLIGENGVLTGRTR